MIMAKVLTVIIQLIEPDPLQHSVRAPPLARSGRTLGSRFVQRPLHCLAPFAGSLLNPAHQLLFLSLNELKIIIG